MKNLSLLLVGLCFSFSAQATKNPLIRVCHLANGTFLSVQVPRDEVAFCQFGGSIIGSEGLLRAQEGLISSAVDLYTRNQGVGIQSCSQVFGFDVQARSYVPTFNPTLCQFSDGSWISLEVLSRGSGHPDNAWLDSALRSLGLMR